LPWQHTRDPYRVWLSEIMLQQTTVAAVIPYFQAFLARWPDVGALAQAPLEQVLSAWAGLGYYARARNLHACALAVSALPGGTFPDTEEALRALPGIGPYTAAAIAAIAFGRRSAVVDGNIERVIARLFAIETPLPQAKPEIKAHVAELTPEDRPGDFAQAMMDLGATVCNPRSPACQACPWTGYCVARAKGMHTELPIKAPKRARPLKRGLAYVALSPEGRVLLRTRPPKGLLGGMDEVPNSGWEKDAAAAPFPAQWQKLPGLVRHAFTHFELELEVWTARIEGPAPAPCRWVALEEAGAHALPNLFRKVLDHALNQGNWGPLFAAARDRG
ncbi:MAG TPA: A/G-specific adenine glycosylase, partial [Alphaproteobacteria bacterium]|nr:A/G-specific adenine glycosylase [Alphaproteobacteria bacterium]